MMFLCFSIFYATMLSICVIYCGFLDESNNDICKDIKYGATIIISSLLFAYIYYAIKVIIYYNF